MTIETMGEIVPSPAETRQVIAVELQGLLIQTGEGPFHPSAW
jgi:hypothetical protein